MLAGILFLTLIILVAGLITVDVLRTPTEAQAVQAHGHGSELKAAGARGGTAVHAFPREPAVRDKAVPPAAGAARFGTSPADVDSFDRPDDAARAFDQMRREMSQSAASEAALRGKFNAMYVNLSRRSQALVERQLRLIESLEHSEPDMQRRASLAKLNRIAMRMHRNSQNLLVLAGQEPTTGWNQPVTLVHLVEAALSEIEDYERVAFEVQPDIAVRGPAVHDAVHLLVELIDNATAFSAADMPVNVTGRTLTSGGALVEITDRGIGMLAKEMAYANHQLDNPPAPEIDVPKWMGLLVVARLAARHGIRVRLNQSEIGGLTAMVWFPDEILTRYAAPADPGRAAEQRAAAVSTAPLASVGASMPDMLAARPDPAWSARGAQATLQAEPAAAGRLTRSGPGVLSGDDGVVIPHAGSQAKMHGPPIYDEVESRWSRGGREALGSPGPVAPSGPVLSPSPVAPPSPVTSPGPSASTGAVASPSPVLSPSQVTSPGPAASGPAASGLPRRPPPATAGSRAVPGTSPGTANRPGAMPSGHTGYQRGVGQGWAGPADEANAGGQDES